ncbi:hypothetical protein J43TS3_09500 [Ornithinibacillus bavariensis]|uniref:Uncharacterized protein n=1 Tax=Ornithinibacillus bavariensis TaxID=545502 RepID=A0A919X793_9BACI|nr:hypothetical protein J43TS3_09500 [Ornithinibacillus bavariensis]
MDQDTEKQTLEELKKLNRTLDNIIYTIDYIDRDGNPSFIILDLMKSFLIRVVILVLL